MISSDVDTIASVDLSPAERSWLRDEQVRHERLLAQLKAEFRQFRQQGRKEIVPEVPAVVESVVKPLISPTPEPVSEKRPPADDKKPLPRKKIVFNTL